MILGQSWRTYATRAQSGTRKDFFGTWHLMPSHFLFLTNDQRPPIVNNKRMYKPYTYLTAYRLYTNYRCYKITQWVKYFYANRERCEGYL